MRYPAIIAVLAMVGTTATAHADDALERKRRAYALMVEGQARFDLGKFDEAINLFQNAYQVFPYAEALYGLGQAHRMKKDYERAVFFYKSYLRNAPNDARERGVVEERLVEMEQLLAAQKASATKPPQGVEKPPAPDGTKLSPPPARPPAKPKLQMTVEPSEEWYGDTWGWSLTAAGVATATVGTWLVADGAGTCRDADQLCGGNAREQVWGWAILGTGVAVVATGVVKLVVTTPPEKRYQLVLGDHYVGVAGTF